MGVRHRRPSSNSDDRVIITRTPLRITLGGGGTDLPGYYRKRGGGFLVAAAITKYVFIAVNRNFDGDFLLKYSQVERVRRSDATPSTGCSGRSCSSPRSERRRRDLVDGRHPRRHRARLVGCVHGRCAPGAPRAPAASIRRTWSCAELACHIEIERLGEPIGKQDQYIAAVGGITAFSFERRRRGRGPTARPRARRRGTGSRTTSCSSTPASADRRPRCSRSRRDRRLGDAPAPRARREPRRGQGARSRRPPTRSSAVTSTRSVRCSPSNGSGSSNDRRRRCTTGRRWIRAGLDAGATGGKLVGAGDGGFLLFYAESKADLREVMRHARSRRGALRHRLPGATVIVAE